MFSIGSTNKVCKICISNMYAFITITSCMLTVKCVPLQYYITNLNVFRKYQVYKYMKNYLHCHS